MPSEWLTALLAFLGGGLGSGLTYAAALRGDRLRETAARREEWGRRFTAALDDLGDSSARRRRLGQVLLERLASSDLASREERSLAREMLAEAARSTPEGRDLQTLLGPDPDLDDIEFVPDTGSELERPSREEEQP